MLQKFVKLVSEEVKVATSHYSERVIHIDARFDKAMMHRGSIYLINYHRMTRLKELVKLSVQRGHLGGKRLCYCYLVHWVDSVYIDMI